MDVLFFMLVGVALTLGAVCLRRYMAEFYGQSPEDYEDGYPGFDLKRHLNGKMICEGVIFGPMGRVTSTFCADFDITWDNDTGTMDEVFRYNDGTVQKRQWIIQLGENGKFTTRAEDVPGGGRGVQSGMSVQMLYKIRLPQEAGGHLLSSVDWMYLTPGGAIVNRSQFRKFGFKVAELVATIKPKETT